MRLRVTTASVAVGAALFAFTAVAGATMVGIYRNSMETTAQRSQLIKLSGRSCVRGGSNHALRIAIGKRTKECSYRTPVIGRDLEIAATERLLSGTPAPLQHKAFLGLELRAGGGAQYQLAVYPLQQKVQLRKNLSGGAVEYLAIEKAVTSVKGINEANQLRLSAVNITSGPERGQAQLRGYVGGTLVVEATDAGAGELSGRAAAVSAGSANNSTGLLASIDDVVIRVPSPF
ncbi:MAG TPA: hypothetical protein VII45_09935 [Solirubrobacterales bacterium]